MNESPSFQQIMDVQSKSIELQNMHWLKYELFTFQFWLLLAMLILPWFLWWKIADKKRLLELVIYGLMVESIVTVLDEVGCQLNLWEYRFDIEPLFPRLIPMNFTMLPIYYMFIYQYFTKWKGYLAVNILGAAILAFIAEPLIALTKIYVLLNWKHVYSFPIYIILSIILKAMIELIIKIHKRAFL